MVGSNYTELRGPRPDDARRVQGTLGLQPRRRGPIFGDRLWSLGQLRTEGYKNTVPGMLRRERGQPEQLDVCARPLTTGLSGGVVQYLRAPSLPGRSRPGTRSAPRGTSRSPAKARRSATTPRRAVTPTRIRSSAPAPRRRRCCSATALGNRCLPQRLPAGAAGALDVARDESPAARSRMGTTSGRWVKVDAWTGPEPDSHGRSVRPALRLASPASMGLPTSPSGRRTGRALDHGLQLLRASASMVLASHNIKAGPGVAPRGQPDQPQQRSVPELPPEQRRAEPVHADDQQGRGTVGRTRRSSRTRTTWAGSRSRARSATTMRGASSRANHPGALLPAGQDLSGHTRVFDNDLTPRGGVAMDVFGNGKTSLKFSWALPRSGAERGLLHHQQPDRPAVDHRRRTWTDANNNKVVDCNLLSQLAQSPATTGSIDTCGVGSPNFGTELRHRRSTRR